MKMYKCPKCGQAPKSVDEIRHISFYRELSCCGNSTMVYEEYNVNKGDEIKARVRRLAIKAWNEYAKANRPKRSVWQWLKGNVNAAKKST